MKYDFKEKKIVVSQLLKHFSHINYPISDIKIYMVNYVHIICIYLKLFAMYNRQRYALKGFWQGIVCIYGYVLSH